MNADRGSARSFVLLLGVVSLLGDMTYEEEGRVEDAEFEPPRARA